MTVTIIPRQPMKSGAEKVKVLSPYSGGFVKAARQMNGCFIRETGAWYFDVEDLDIVRARVKEFYGYDPLDEVQEERVTVEIEAYGPYWARSYFAMGRDIAFRPYNDAGVRMGEGCSVVSGGFPSRGGSVKNPSLNPEEGTVVRVRDVPRSLAEEYLETHVGEIVGEAKSETTLEQVQRLVRALTKKEKEALRASLTAEEGVTK